MLLLRLERLSDLLKNRAQLCNQELNAAVWSVNTRGNFGQFVEHLFEQCLSPVIDVLALLGSDQHILEAVKVPFVEDAEVELHHTCVA